MPIREVTRLVAECDYCGYTTDTFALFMEIQRLRSLGWVIQEDSLDGARGEVCCRECSAKRMFTRGDAERKQGESVLRKMFEGSVV